MVATRTMSGGKAICPRGGGEVPERRSPVKFQAEAADVSRGALAAPAVQ